MNDHLETASQFVGQVLVGESEPAGCDCDQDSTCIVECRYCGHWPCGCGG